MKKNMEGKVDVPEQERYNAALSYVWILCLYPLLFKKNSSFIQFHAKQGLALFVIEVLSMALFIFAPFVILICVVASLWGIKSALDGRYWTLPLIGDWIKKTKI